ncbi:hypothetical protein [Xenophilus azovorans]|uniref:hypothetical protein n=1 Tax=Xenophilus azovorans TaxID=151755 RepID=UPI00056DA127|nr:hypothetical protein [Xenophilus azovorans]
MTDIRWNLLTERSFAPQRYRIGLVVRGMARPGAAPPSEGHADCVLSSGEPIGFFAETGIPVSGSRGSETATLGVRALSATLAGTVWGYRELMVHRRPYVDRAAAAATGAVSTLLAIEVSERECRQFERAWSSMRVDPGMFGIVGLNCATHAGYAFAAAGLLTRADSGGRHAATSDMDGLDTPTQLFHQLVRGPANERCEVYTGFFGFQPASGWGYRVSFDPR